MLLWKSTGNKSLQRRRSCSSAKKLTLVKFGRNCSCLQLEHRREKKLTNNPGAMVAAKRNWQNSSRSCICTWCRWCRLRRWRWPCCENQRWLTSTLLSLPDMMALVGRSWRVLDHVTWCQPKNCVQQWMLGESKVGSYGKITYRAG